MPLANYDGMTEVQAIDHELRMDRADKLEAFTEAIGNLPDNEIELTETVRVDKKAK